MQLEQIRGVIMFLIFAGEEYYPSGGAVDFVATSPTLLKAQQLVEMAEGELKDDHRWVHIAKFDGEFLTVVASWHKNLRVHKDKLGFDFKEPDNPKFAPGVEEQLTWWSLSEYSWATDGNFWIIDGIHHLPLLKDEQ